MEKGLISMRPRENGAGHPGPSQLVWGPPPAAETWLARAVSLEGIRPQNRPTGAVQGLADLMAVAVLCVGWTHGVPRGIATGEK